MLEELRSEAVKQGEYQSVGKQTRSENELESDHDTEVARTILRLSDNNHMDSYASPHGDQYRNINSMSNMGGVTQGQTHLPLNFNPFESFHIPPENGSTQFMHNISASSPAIFASETTGWGVFDSFVSRLNRSLQGSILCEFL